jgi:O-antigen/teichoic acid export membrane protein
MTAIRNSLLWSLGGRYLTLVLQLVSFFILARLLTPEDIGLYSVAAALIGLTQVLREFGISSYLVQEKELTEARIRSAFTISLLLSVLICLVILGLAGPVSAFYRDSRLEQVVQVLGLSFLLIPFSSTAQAILSREMKFQALFWISTTSSVLSQLAALTMAFYGLGYWSLVWASLLATVISSIGAAIAARGGFVHRLAVSEWRRIVSFGGQSVLGRIISEISLSFNDLVVGRVLGLAPVGILSRAQGVMNLCHRDFIGAIRSVAFPAFAQAHREGRNAEELHAKFITNVAAFAWPFYGCLALFPLEALNTLFGPQWDAAAPLVPVFCAAGAVAVLWSFISVLLTATGNIGSTLRIELVIQPIRIALLLAIALLWPVLPAFAWALLAIYCLQNLVAYGFKQRVLPTPFGELGKALLPSIFLSLLSLLPALLFKILLGSQLIAVHNSLGIFSLAVGITALGWFGALFGLRHPLLQDPMLAPIKAKLCHLFKMNKRN